MKDLLEKLHKVQKQLQEQIETNNNLKQDLASAHEKIKHQDSMIKGLNFSIQSKEENIIDLDR